MDYALLNLALTFVLLVATFVFRKRIIRGISRVIGPYVVQSVVAWAFDTKQVEHEDGTVVEIKALSAPASALLAALVPALVAWAKKSFKFNLPAGLSSIPGLDMSKIGEALPQLIMAMPGKNLSLGGFKIPKEIAAALSGIFGPMVQNFVPGAKPGVGKGKETENPFLKEIIP